jgi:light-regulated signal transduction histidine kinase (bacteriophytochrome)
MSARRIPGDGGGSICAIFTDLTTQRREEALARAEEEARSQREIAERRAAELARSNADLERFAQIASHDLKEPLRGISNFASFLLEDEGERVSTQGAHKLKTIVRLARHMHGLLDSLLEYAMVGRTPPCPEPCDLGQIARDVIESVSGLLAERGARAVVEGELPKCRCDPVRLNQALANLIVNAVKYNESGAPLVTIGARREKDGSVVLRVVDNGIGIDPRHHYRIFEIFTRLHGRERFGGGTGVGLSIVKSIAEQHGGRVWVESTPGRGSTFCLQLPGEAR